MQEKFEGRIIPEQEGGAGSWVQDIEKDKAIEFVMKKNAQIETGEIKFPEGSKYQTGPSRSGNDSEVGIYFFDPTAKKEE